MRTEVVHLLAANQTLKAVYQEMEDRIETSNRKILRLAYQNVRLKAGLIDLIAAITAFELSPFDPKMRIYLPLLRARKVLADCCAEEQPYYHTPQGGVKMSVVRGWCIVKEYQDVPDGAVIHAGDGYAGYSCELSGVRKGGFYLCKASAEKDAVKLSAVNPSVRYQVVPAVDYEVDDQNV